MRIDRETKVVDVWARFLSVWSDIIKDLSSARDLRVTFTHDDRLFYVGAMLSVVASLLFAATSTSS